MAGFIEHRWSTYNNLLSKIVDGIATRKKKCQEYVFLSVRTFSLIFEVRVVILVTPKTGSGAKRRVVCVVKLFYLNFLVE